MVRLKFENDKIRQISSDEIPGDTQREFESRFQHDNNEDDEISVPLKNPRGFECLLKYIQTGVIKPPCTLVT